MNHLERCWKLEIRTLDACTSKPVHPFRAGHSWLRQHWQRLLNRLAHASELHVWRRIDRSGAHYWRAYDPATRRSTTGSEAEIRVWIEQLHYLK